MKVISVETWSSHHCGHYFHHYLAIKRFTRSGAVPLVCVIVGFAEEEEKEGFEGYAVYDRNEVKENSHQKHPP